MISRFARFAAIVALVAFGQASSVCEPIAAAPTPPADGITEYTIDCRILGEPPAGASRTRKVNLIKMTVPTIRLEDGQTATVSDTTETALAVAEKVVDGEKVPVARVVKEGSTVEATVIKVDEQSVVLDLRSEFQSANGSLKTEADGGESGQLVSESWRLVKRVPLGATTTARFNGVKIEVVVNRAE
jgi:hypothetical protein